MALSTLAAGAKLRASDVNTIINQINNSAVKSALKATDENVSSATTGTTLHNDTALFLTVAANTNYKLDLALLMVDAAGTGIDVKAAWTMPTSCKLDAAVASPHANWVSPAGSANEIEWAGWQNETSSPTATKNWGSNNVAFSYHVRGLLRVGATAGTLQFQWAQGNSSASNLTMKSGSLLTLTPLL